MNYENEKDIIKDIYDSWYIIGTSRIEYNELNTVNTSVRYDWYSHKIVGGQNGRMIAITLRRSPTARPHPTINTYDHQFNNLGDIILPVKANELFIYVLPTDEVVVITQNGEVFKYFHDKIVDQYKMDIDNEINNIAFYDTGCLVIDNVGNVYMLENYTKCKLFAHLETKDYPHDLVAVPPEYTSDGNPILYISFSDEYLWVTNGNNFKIKLDGNPEFLSLSNDYSKIAYLISDVGLIVADITLSHILHKFDLDNTGQAVGIGFISNDIPCIYYHDQIDVFTDLETESFFFNGIPYLIPGETSSYVITPFETIKIAEIGSQSILVNEDDPSTKLLWAYRNRNHSVILDLGEDLNIAIQRLCEISLLFDSIDAQKLLLRAAVFGANFIKNCDRQPIIDATRTLRVYNNLKRILNVCLNPEDVDSADKIKNAAMRCFNRDNHAFGAAMLSAHGLPTTSATTDYCVRITDMCDSDEIVKKTFQKHSGPNFDAPEVASKLVQCGRPELADYAASLTINMEEGVAYFMRQGQYGPAVDLASKSGDSLLFVKTLREIDESGGNVVQYLQKSPSAYTLAFNIYGNSKVSGIDPDGLNSLQFLIVEASQFKSKEISTERLLTSASLLKRVKKGGAPGLITEDLRLNVEFAANSRLAAEEYGRKVGRQLPASSLNAAFKDLASDGDIDGILKICKKMKLPEEHGFSIFAKEIIKEGSFDKLEKIYEYPRGIPLTASIIWVSGERECARSFVENSPNASAKQELLARMESDGFPLIGQEDVIGPLSLFKTGLLSFM